MKSIVIYGVLVNVAAFLMYGIDKRNAKHKLQRIPEKTLLGIAAVGGSIGAYAGMQFFHHKTRKAKFYLGVPLIFIAQVFILSYLYR